MEAKGLGKTSTGIQPNVAGLLCYLAGFITGIIFFLIEKENKFVRFHAMQSIVTFGGSFVLGFVIGIIPIIGLMIQSLIWVVDIILWILLMIKAYQGEEFKLPFFGDIAEKQLK